MKKILFVLVSTVLVLGVFSFVPKASAASKPFDYELVYQSPYPATMTPGSIANVWIEVKNTGTVTWNRDGIINVVRLGAGSKYGSSDQQRDYVSEFANSDWLSTNRPTAILHPVIKPGWNTRFQFNIKAPLIPGTYKAYFTPVVEGVEWMKDIGIYWAITVSGSTSCVPEGGSLGAVIPDNNAQCCAGLVPYIPEGLIGTRGTCQVPGYTPPQSNTNATVTSLSLVPNGAVSVKSGTVYDFTLIANYSDGSTKNVTSSAVWDVVYDTGTGTMHRDIPGRFIAGGMGTCTVTASYGGKNVTSGIVTVTGL